MSPHLFGTLPPSFIPPFPVEKFSNEIIESGLSSQDNPLADSQSIFSSSPQINEEIYQQDVIEDSQQIIEPPCPEAPNAPLDFPNPDNQSPSPAFNDKFKAVLSASLPTWEEFNSLVHEFVNFSQVHISLKKDDIRPAIFKQDNPLNAKYIQTLYHRNCRQGVWKV